MNQQHGPPLPPGWSHAFTPQGQIYFINHADGTTSWQDPRINIYGNPDPSNSNHGNADSSNSNHGNQDPRISTQFAPSGQTLLVQMVKKYRCITADEKLNKQQRKEWSNNRSNCTEENLETVQTCVTDLQKQICVQGFPPWESPPAEMAINVCRMIENVMEDYVENGRMALEDCQKMWFELLLRLLETGPGSTAANMIKVRVLKTQDMRKYLEELRGKDLTRMITSLKMWIHISEEPAVSIKNQSADWKKGTMDVLRRLLGTDNNNKVYEPEINQQFIELYLFYFQKMGKEPEIYTEHCCDLMDAIERMYHEKHDKNPFLLLEKTDILKMHWKTFGAVICSNEFRFEKQIRRASDLTKKMTLCILEKDWLIDVIDDMLDLMKKYYVRKNALDNYYKDVLRPIRHLLEKTPEQVYNKHPGIVEKMVPVVTELVQRDPNHMDWAYGITGIMVDQCSAKKGTEKNWITLMKALAKSGNEDGLRRCAYTLNEGKFKKIWNWKQNFEEAREIIKGTSGIHQHMTGKKDTDKTLVDKAGDVVHRLLDQLKLVKMQHKVSEDVAVIAITVMEKKSETLNKYVEEFITDIPFEGCRDVIPDLMRRFSLLVFDQEYPWDERDTKRCGNYFMRGVLDAYSSGKDMPDSVNKTFVRMLIWTMQTDGLDYIDLENGSATFYAVVASQTLITFVTKHVQNQNAAVCKPLVPAILDQMMHEEGSLANASMVVLQSIGIQAAFLVVDHLSRLIDWCKIKPSSDTLYAITKPYEESNGFSKEEFHDVMVIIQDNADDESMMGCMLLKAMAVKQGELFTQHHVDFLITLLGKQTVQYQVLLVLGELIPKKPDLFGENMIKHVLQNTEINLMFTSGIQMIAVNLGLKKEPLVGKILEALIVLAKRCPDPNYLYALLDAMKTLGAKYGVDMLKPHRKYFEDVQKNGKTTYLNELAVTIVNAMDGISMKGIVVEVIQTKEKVKELDQKVTKVEGEVNGLKTTVDKHDKEIKTVKTGIKKVEKRVDVAEQDIKVTKVKVEEIDKKTISNAPKWSRDLSKLMNPTSDHDWRLLAQRLGYSPQDIKAWATQNDPCMSLLSEWYATYKTIEATHAVLTALQEMDRLDAAIIVENSMKAVDDVVKEAPEYAKPPPIFLSYQWGHQNEVKLLRKHLLMAGYECWMDIGQMGGGDKLFEKIDNGIRGSKVIICCVSEKYAKSPNCNREVNLAVNLGKPMIPLLMEKMGWPPHGSMGPIFSEYLFVRFFQRGGEETNDQRYWPAPKFQELLMQLNIYKTLPDESLITKEYKKWWVPVAEEIVITKKKPSTGVKNTASTAGDKDGESKSPDVFLSYQWGKQKQIKQLYKRLTELGLTCWMDIYQMGGGDSLYDKIDRGVRGCKIVLSCVTTKYAVSANCRREVSLADSLKKPLVPLLLEKMEWPPSGPMSMVFTQLLFINFYRDEEVQMSWTGEKFDELLAKVTEHVPSVIQGPDDSKPNEETEMQGKKSEEEKLPTSQNAASNASSTNQHQPAPPPPPPPPEQSTGSQHVAQPSSQPPPPPLTPAYHQQSTQSPQPLQGQPYTQQAAYQQQPYGQHAQSQQAPQQAPQDQRYAQTYNQQQPYGQPLQPQPQSHQQMPQQVQPHSQPTQASPQSGRVNEKSSSCILL
ncbi:uncharacterized protein [Argopecten irradians]|uniref:uncharacterized protein n=1 Tax=Argopecten irradians TaxID=31199 RepID=UPI0037206F8E